MIIDTHCHLNSDELYKKRDQIIKDALRVGVKKMICVGYDYPSSVLAVKIAHEYPGIVFAAVGIHPSECIHAEEDDLHKITDLLADPAVVAVGEIGLDYHFGDVPEMIQKQYFEKQIEMASLYNKPVIIHMRDAVNDTITILKKNKKLLKHSGVIHCYSGSPESVNDFINLGFYLSFGGPLTFKNAKTPKHSILKVPLDKLLFETDSPYLTPDPFRGRENEPSNIIFVIRYASEVLGKSISELEAREEENVDKLFKI